ncbi:MAG TPA: nucleoside recognition domain-containing protein [Vulgatibacter sp.]|nr:nucleoside recognition domain-containing protein [Vulgatibacter sp.]
MGIVWFLLLALGLAAAVAGGDVEGFTKGALDGAGGAITLAIGLVGMLALWSGLLRIAQEAGLTALLSRAVAPLMRRLFPDVPKDHPAVAAMTLNLAANVLGLGNAATPIGLDAMEKLQTLNRRKDTATDAMVLFLVINASSVQLVPATVVALRAAGGAAAPADVVGPTLLATFVSTVVGIAAAKILAPLWPMRAPALEVEP